MKPFTCVAIFLIMTIHAAPLSFTAWPESGLASKNYQNTCGIRSLVLCAHLLGLHLSMGALLAERPMRSEGVDFAELAAIAERHGLYALPVRCNSSSLAALTSRSRPAIVSTAGKSHFVVVVADERGDCIHVYEPNTFEHMTMDTAELGHMMGGEALLISRERTSVLMLAITQLRYVICAIVGTCLCLMACVGGFCRLRSSRGKSGCDHVSSLAAGLVVFLCSLIFPHMLHGAPSDSGVAADPAAEIEELLSQGRYVVAGIRASASIADAGPAASPELLFKAAEAVARGGYMEHGFVLAQRALGSLSSAPEDRPQGQQLERLTTVAGILRAHGEMDCCATMLMALDRSHDSTSPWYEASYLKLNQRDVAGFLRLYGRAVVCDPANPRALAGRALIASGAGADRREVLDLWCRTAVESYDNDRVWSQIFVGLRDKTGALPKPGEWADISRSVFADGRLRAVLDWMYYQSCGETKTAQEALRTLVPTEADDPRFDLFRRELLVRAGLARDAALGLGPPPTDPYGRVFHYKFRLMQAENTPEGDIGQAAHGFRVAIVDSMRLAGVSEPDCETARNSLARSLANRCLTRMNMASAAKVLEADRASLDAKNLQMLAAIHLHMGNAIGFRACVREQLAHAQGAGRESALNRFLSHAVFAEDWNAIEELTASPGLTVEEARLATDRLQLKNAADLPRHGIRAVPGQLVASWLEPWQFDLLGPCAEASAYSVLRFRGWRGSYKEFSRTLQAMRAEGEHPMATIARKAREEGLDVLYLAPLPDVLIKLVGEDHPLILTGTTEIEGVTLGHASVVTGFDSRLREVFLLDNSEEGEARINYDDLCDARVLVLVARPEVVRNAAKELNAYSVPPPWDIAEPIDPTRIALADPSLRYWLCRLSGDALRKRDRAGALGFYEQALKLRTPQDVAFYGTVSNLYLEEGRFQDALTTVGKGLEVDARSLELLGRYVEVRMTYALQHNVLNATLAEQLLDVTRQMEGINPGYAYTFFLRGDIFIRGSRFDQAFAAFQQYLDKWSTMGDGQKEFTIRQYRTALGGIEVCRRALFDGE